MTTKTKTRTITMTGRPPVKIKEEEWPVIAVGSRFDWEGQYEFQSNRKWKDSIRVRQHNDGRAIVYGVSDFDTNWQSENGYCYKAGILLDKGDSIPDGIYSVAKELVSLGASEDDLRRVAAECIANLPAEEI